MSEVPGMLKGMGRSGKGPLSAISGAMFAGACARHEEDIRWAQ